MHVLRDVQRKQAFCFNVAVIAFVPELSVAVACLKKVYFVIHSVCCCIDSNGPGPGHSCTGSPACCCSTRRLAVP
jgi:hypothetical protein